MNTEPISLPDQATTVLERARELIAEGRHAEALPSLRRANEADPSHAQVRSCYGLCLGLAERRYNEAVDLCQSAVKQEFFNPDLYLNIAKLNLSFGFKAEGLRYLRRARMIDPSSPGIDGLLEQLGNRKEPVLGFLPRRHLINRWLGSARYTFGRFARDLETLEQRAA